MSSSDLSRRNDDDPSSRADTPSGARQRTGRGAARSAPPPSPERPTLVGKTAPPLIVSVPPPFWVRISQFFWLLSLVAGAVALVYLFIIRQGQLPGLIEVIKHVDDTRADETYELAADIIFWSIFGTFAAIIFFQIIFLVSFNNRRPNARWYLLMTILLLGAMVYIAGEVVGTGDRGVLLRQLLYVQSGLALIGLLVGLLPPALRWTARRHDVRVGGTVESVKHDL